MVQMVQMVHAKVVQKKRAIELRQQGYSIPEIAREVGVNQGSVSRWCTNIILTTEQIDRLVAKSRANKANLIMGEVNRKERQARQLEQQEKGIKSVDVLSERELLLIGAALYAAEGGKTERSIVFANSDPDIIRIFIKWLTKCCSVKFDDIKLMMHIHEDLQEEEEKRFWMTLLGAKEEQFYKTQVKKNPDKGIRKKIEYHGTLQVRLLKGTNLFYYVEGLIQGIKNQGP